MPARTAAQFEPHQVESDSARSNVDTTGDAALEVTGNTANGNGVDAADGAGIRATGRANRIEDNHVVANDRGLFVSEQRNFIVRNTARSNGENFNVVAGNRIAQIVVVATNAADITGANSGSSDGFTNVDPWANFSF